MKLKLLLLLIFCLLTVQVFTQDFTYISGARSKALADHATTFTDHWSAINNQAGLGFVTAFSAGIYFENRFNLKELNSGTFTMAIPAGKQSAVGISLYAFQQSVLFSRQKFGLGYGIKLSPTFSAGININLIRTSISDYADNLSLCGEIGILYMLTPKIRLGVHVFNPTASKYRGNEEEKIPVMMRMGLSYSISQKTLILIEINNISFEGFGCKAAFEHHLSERFSLQAGLNTKNWISSFGLRLRLKNISLNIAMQFYQVLGSTPGISLDYTSFN